MINFLSSQAPDSVMLELSANSTRRAHWDAKLGFQASRRAFSVPIYSLFPDGGLVGCLDVVITRIYPQQVRFIFTKKNSAPVFKIDWFYCKFAANSSLIIFNLSILFI